MIGFRAVTPVHIAPGCVSRLPEITRTLNFHGALLVIDEGMRATPWPERILDALAEPGLHVEIFDEVESNPSTATVTRMADLIREEKLDGVVGLGGGSVIDAAKAAAMLAANSGRAEHYEGENRYRNRPRPFVAVPTTCGTGSEVTWVSVLTHRPTQAKISVKGETMFPDQALVDAELLCTLPPQLVAWTGVDALTHALEATTGDLANPPSDAVAEKAVSLLFRYLPRAFADIAGDGEARAAVMAAATLAGLAFSGADVAGVHCLSESIGGLTDLSHGLLNAVLVAPVLRYHSASIEQRLADLQGLVEPAEGAQESVPERAERFLQRLEALLRQLEIPAFSSLGIAEEDYPKIAVGAMRNSSNGSNPQPMAATHYQEILAGL
ncbi:MAG: iron-containing alcohol dehydrogenase [bacterium]|nr:iron-containing alcohol dehydrogenase [bacterium]